MSRTVDDIPAWLAGVYEVRPGTAVRVFMARLMHIEKVRDTQNLRNTCPVVAAAILIPVNNTFSEAWNSSVADTISMKGKKTMMSSILVETVSPWYGNIIDLSSHWK